MVSVCPTLRTGVVTVGHAAALRYEGAGGAGGLVVAQLCLSLPGCRHHHRPRLTGKTLPDGGCEFWPTADSFKLRPGGVKYQNIEIKILNCCIKQELSFRFEIFESIINSILIARIMFMIDWQS